MVPHRSTNSDVFIEASCHGLQKVHKFHDIQCHGDFGTRFPTETLINTTSPEGCMQFHDDRCDLRSHRKKSHRNEKGAMRKRLYRFGASCIASKHHLLFPTLHITHNKLHITHHTLHVSSCMWQSRGISISQIGSYGYCSPYAIENCTLHLSGVPTLIIF